jgi:hypothetical protein
VLHQATRKRDKQGCIVAELEDYRVARELLNGLISYEVERSVPESIRATVRAVQMLTFTLSPLQPIAEADRGLHGALLKLHRSATLEILAHELNLPLTDAARKVEAAVKAGLIQWGIGTGTTTVAAVARLLGIDKSSAHRRVASAIERGYLANDESLRERPAKLRIGEPLPDPNAGLLPTVEEVMARRAPVVANLEFHPAPVMLNGNGRSGAGETLGEDITDEARSGH